MTRAVALLAALVFLPVASAADPDPKSLVVPAATAARAAELVAHLSDRAYADRDAATKELRKLGRLALPALRDALAHSTNAETRLRLDLLLPAALAADTRARIECFLADKDGKFQHDLPVAKAFFEAAGRTAAAKQLFADLMRSANRDLLLALDGSEADLQQKYAARRGELGLPTNVGAIGPRVDGAGAVTALDLAALLFADSRLPDRGVAGIGAARQMPLISNFQFQQALTAALTTDDRRDALAGIVGHWAETREQPQSIYYAVLAMNRASLPHALPAARKLASGAVKGGPVTYRSQSLAYVGRFGTADDVAIFEKLFDDKGTLITVDGVASRRLTIQVRDFALAMALVRNNLKPADFGLVFRYAKNATVTDSLKYAVTAYYFDAETEEGADDLRKAAFKKYAEWKEQQKKK